VSLNPVAVIATTEATKAPRIGKEFLKVLKGSAVPGKNKTK